MASALLCHAGVGRPAQPGTVYLVGAGPGDPDLLTLRARDVIASCDVLLYDHLVNPGILDHAPPHAQRRYTGKVGHGSQHSQCAIEAALVESARRRLRVVRLKGGDPMLFGRGGEEAAALAAAGVPFEIVPGVSSAFAVPAYAGIPVTHRDLASTLAIVAGHCAGPGRRTAQAVAGADTIVVLMGMARVGELSDELMAAGREPATPAAAIERGTWDRQRTVVATLGTLAAAVARDGLRAPAVIVVGEVVRLRETLAWFAADYAAEPTSM